MGNYRELHIISSPSQIRRRDADTAIKGLGNGKRVVFKKVEARSIVLVTETDGELFTGKHALHTGPGKQPLEVYSVGYDLGADWEEIDRDDNNDSEEQRRARINEALIQDEAFVNQGRFNRFVMWIKGIVTIATNAVRLGLNAIWGVIKHVSSAAAHSAPSPNALIQGIEALGLKAGLSAMMPVTASMDEVVSLAEQLPTSKHGPLQWILDNFPRVESCLVKALTWFGVAMSVIELAKGVFTTYQAFKTHSQAVETFQPLVQQTKNYAETLKAVTENDIFFEDEEHYNRILDVTQPALRGLFYNMRSHLPEWSNRIAAIQEDRTTKSRSLFFRLLLELASAAVLGLSGNIPLLVITVSINLLRHISELATHYAETASMKIVDVIRSMTNTPCEFPEWTLVTDKGPLLATAEALSELCTEIQPAFHLSFGGFFTHCWHQFKESLSSAWNWLTGIFWGVVGFGRLCFTDPSAAAQLVSSWVESALDGLDNAFHRAFSAVERAVERVISYASEVATSIFNFFRSWFMSICDISPF